MASDPDPHPDSSPSGPSEAPDQLTPVYEPGRESVEDAPELKGSDQILEFEKSLPDWMHEAGIPDGVSGTAGDVKAQDDLAR